MKIFLDDIRSPPGPGWAVFRSAEELIRFITDGLSGDVETVKEWSLDHDLGEGNMSGYDFLVWVEKKAFAGELRGFNPDRVHVHSANPVGRSNMLRVLEALRRHMPG